METIGSQGFIIPLDELEADEIAFSILGMGREQVMDTFDDVYEDTRATFGAQAQCRALYRGYAVKSVENGALYLEDGIELQSSRLSEMLGSADEVVMYAVTVVGCEELANDPACDVFESMFYNAWGAGYSMAGRAWVEHAIAARANETGRFASRGWAPGVDGVEGALQQVLFDALDPSQIGIRLVGGMHVHPVMTITGFIGLSNDPAIETNASERVQNH